MPYDFQWTDLGSLGKVLTSLLSIERRFDISPDIMSLQIIVPAKINDTVTLGRYLVAAAKSIYANKQLRRFAIRFFAQTQGSALSRVRFPGRSVMAFRAKNGKIHLLEAIQPQIFSSKSKNGKPRTKEFVLIRAFNINLAASLNKGWGPTATKASRKESDRYYKRGLYDDARGLLEVAGKFAAEAYDVELVSVVSKQPFPGKRSRVTTGVRVPVHFHKRGDKWIVTNPPKPK